MKKLSKSEMKSIEGGKTACIILYNMFDPDYYHKTYKGNHTDDRMRTLEVYNKPGLYMSIYGR